MKTHGPHPIAESDLISQPSPVQRARRSLFHIIVRPIRHGLTRKRKSRQLALDLIRRKREQRGIFALEPMAYRALADPNKLLWIRFADVRFKLTKRNSLLVRRGEILTGDWDIELSAIAESIKHRSIVQHFKQGMAWEETLLFRKYQQRLVAGESIRGCMSIAELKREYELSIDRLHARIKAKGFQVRRRIFRSRWRDIPHVHIGRDGTFILGNDGNHRFAIATVLEIERLPFLVYGRHAEWQALREKIFAARADEIDTLLTPELAGHPDLADVIAHAHAAASSGS